MSHLFLTGSSGIGKSTLLKNAFQSLHCPVSGLFTQRLVLEDGTAAGFRLLPWTPELSADCCYDPGLTDIFIRKTEHGWVKDPAVFDSFGVRLLNQAASFQGIVCLDEIGGMELLVPAFRKRLYQLLSEHPRCAGVIKGTENLASMLRTIDIPAREEQALLQFHRDLTTRFDSRILCVTSANKELIAAALRSFILRGEAYDI